MAWAGMASPNEESPPLGLTGTRPPRSVAPSRKELLGLALAAEPDVLVPVELEGRREVVDLGEVDVLGPDAGVGVGGLGDGAAGSRRRRRPGGRRVGGEVR